MPNASPTPGKSLLTPDNHALILVDHQSQMAFATHSIELPLLRNNTALVCKAAAGFRVPTLLTTVAEKSFSGPLFPEIKEVFPEAKVIDRTTMNCWEDPNVTEQVNRFDRSRVVFAGLWTGVCIVGPVLSAIDQGFQVYVITDASGDVSQEAHERAVQRMVQAGAIPMTSLQYLLELQRDWARGATYAMTTGVAVAHGGGYGLGVQYAKSMFNASEGGGH
ncbi:hydrolase [Myxococcus fulvus]|uniref:hydrolase n=1 Tax=Myxococcus fulvus TaxID=33 RepID=UPI0020C0D909|nr:hydrolase [Myxococcus fulvus]MCK8503410.1 hydrolase [Myxococcus fulvus]